MGVVGVWGGDPLDWQRLTQAIARNCQCPEDSPVTTCAPHSLLKSQESLDHLAFAATRRDKFWQEETGKMSD